LPRYFEFRIAATSIAQPGIRVDDIACNKSVILVTAWVKDDVRLPANDWRVQFQQPLTMPARTRRVALLTPVGELSAYLAKALAIGLVTEQVPDY
jgi:hypothetical protein